MIELKNVSKYYNNNGVVSLGLRNINLKMTKGEMIAIVGKSGSGKSTLLNVICGVDTYEDGEIYFNGNETSYFNQNDMDLFRKNYVSFIYQNYNIIDSYTVLENVMIPLIINGLSYKDAKAKATELIEKVGLGNRIHNKGIKLSGGEKQRCVIARALANDSPILACDEPTGNLDSKTGKEIIDLIKMVSKDKLVLIVTHNYDEIKDVVSRTITLSDGEVVSDTKAYEDDLPCTQMSLENKKANPKSLAIFALKNLKNTPKKNILSLAVLFCLAFISLALYLSAMVLTYQSSYNSYTGFYNTVHNRIIVYDSNHDALDTSKLDKIEGVKFNNAFYEDIPVYSSLNGISFTFSSYLPKNLDDTFGCKPQNDDDAYVIIPQTYVATNISYLADNLNKNITFNKINLSLNLCGYAISNEIDYPLCVTKKDISKNFTRIYLDQMVTSSTISFTNGNSTTFNDYSNIRYSDSNFFTYYGPNELEVSSLKIVLQNIYEIEIDDFDYRYVEQKNESFDIGINSINLDKVYELTIYTDDVDNAIKLINNSGYSYIQPSKAGIQTQSATYILMIVYICFVTFAILAVVFISYIIIGRIYASKTKDYSILRSLGLVKRDLSKIVDIELILLGLMSSVLAVAIIYIVSAFNIFVKGFVYFNSIGLMIFYFIAMAFFSYLIARRFNRKLFKFSVNNTIKSEVISND